MEYEIVKNKKYAHYRHVMWAGDQAYYLTGGIHSADQAPIEKLHYHNMHEVGICITGSGDYQINDRLYRFKKGDIALINRYTPHYSNSDKTYPAIWKILFFDPIRIMQEGGIIYHQQAFSLANTDFPFSGVFAYDEYPELTQFVEKIVELPKIRDEFTELSIAFWVGNFMIECERYSRTHHIPEKPFMINNGNYHELMPAIHAINFHMANSKLISEEALAQLCNMSVSNFKRVFKKRTGTYPKAFINQTKMAYAEHLLRNTTMTILRISTEVGYSDVSGFNKAFKATFGISPREYRKNS